jgi:hypothetical protein
MGHRFSGKSFVGKPRVDYRLASRPLGAHEQLGLK